MSKTIELINDMIYSSLQAFYLGFLSRHLNIIISDVCH